MVNLRQSLSTTAHRLLASGFLVAAGTAVTATAGPEGGVLTALAGTIAGLGVEFFAGDLQSSVLPALRESPDVLRNHDLSRAAGEAIGEVIRLVASEQPDAADARDLRRLADRAPERWLQLAEGLEAATLGPLREESLADLLAIGMGQDTPTPTLGDEEWRQLLDRLARAALEAPRDVYLSQRAMDAVAGRLGQTFPKALREVLKHDFGKGGRAFPAIVLTLLSGLRAGLGDMEQRDAALRERIERLHALAREEFLGAAEAGQREVLGALRRAELATLSAVGLTQEDLAGRLSSLEALIRDTRSELLAAVGGVAASPSPAAGNLPAPPGPFFGREAELTAWQDRLLADPTRVVTLHGPVGVGKSRAALELGWRVARSGTAAAEHGVWWVAVEGVTSAEELRERIALVLGLTTTEASGGTREALDGYLRARRLVLVLDGVHGSPELAREVSWLVQAPGCRALVTTRSALQIPEEQRLEVGPLPPPPPPRTRGSVAVAALLHEPTVLLFEERARACNPSFRITPDTVGKVAALCRRLDGLPLALEFAAGRTLSLSPGQILTDLDRGLDRLQRRDLSLPEHRRALTAALDASLGDLGTHLRGFLDRLSVFHGGFTLEDAAAVLEGADLDWDLEELVRRSMLRVGGDGPGPPRFTMPRLLREHIGKWLQDPDGPGRGVQEAHARHFSLQAAYWLARVRRPDEAQALSRFTAELDNLTAAATWAESGDDPILAAELWLSLAAYHQRSGLFPASDEALNRALGLLAGAEATGALEACAERQVASLRLDQQRWDEAREAAARATALAGAAGDDAGQAAALALGGLAEYGTGRYSAARPLLERALVAFRSAGDDLGEATLLDNQGLLEMSDPAGDAQRARVLFEGALERRRRAGDQRGVAETLTNLGTLAFHDEDWDLARECFEETLRIEIALGHRFGVARALCNLGEVALRGSAADRAPALLTAAWHLFDECGSVLREHPRRLLQAARGSDPIGELAEAPEALAGASLADVVRWAHGG